MTKTDLILKRNQAPSLGRPTHSENDANLDRLTYWSKEWNAADAPWEHYQQVTDEGFLMIANKTTTDKAAPQPTGAPAFLFPDVPTWSAQSNVSQVSSAIRITNITELFAIRKLRVWIPNISANVSYRVVTTDLITGAIDIGQVFTGDSVGVVGWFTIALPGATNLLPGDEVEVALEALNSSATTTFNANWDYSSAGAADIIPLTGEAFERTNRTYIRFDKTDSDAGDQTANLLSVIPGTTIVSSTLDHTVVSVIDAGTYIEYEIIRTGSAILDGIHNFVFTIPTPTATDYVEILAYWTTNPGDGATIQGALQFDNAAPLINDTGYGVDIEAQHYLASPDWDFQAVSAVGAGASQVQSASSSSIFSIRSELDLSSLFKFVDVPVYNVLITDRRLFIDHTSTAAVTLNLPKVQDALASRLMLELLVIDNAANAGTNNITIVPSGGDTITDTATGLTSIVLAADGVAVRLVPNGLTSWKII